MATCNFYNQAGNGFDLWVTDDDGAEFLTARDVADALEDVERELGRPLVFHTITPRAGYYEGAQLFVQLDEYGRPDEVTNDDARSLWGLTRSRAIREYNAERRRINKKILPMMADRLGFFKIRMIGRFSNGSAVYERARD